MADKEKIYIVLEDQKYSGKHKVYTAGQKFTESELFGDLDMALKGSEKHNVKPKIKEWKAPKPKKEKAENK